jgi:hypothetical protein
MSPSPLAPWRDLSILWLSIIPIAVLLVTVVVLVFLIRGLLALKRWVRLPLLYGQLWALRVQQGTERVCDEIVQVPIQAQSRSTQLRVTLRGVVEYLRGA